MDDIKLVHQLNKKNEKALGVLIERYSGYVSTVIRNISRGVLDTGDSEEVISDVFITIWNNAGHLRAETLRSYIAVIARNLAIDKMRSKHIQLPLDEIETDDGQDIEYETERKALAVELNRVIDEMQPRDRELLVRFYFYYQSLPQIAEEMKLGLSACTTALHRARNKLRKKLTERGYDYEA